ncbi:Hypothetical protein NocV09_01000400 [Nannochloropsis oceanica]
MTAPANPPVLTGQSSKKPKHKQRAVSHLTPVHGSNQQKSLLPVPPPSIPITVAPRVCKEEGGRGEEGAGAGAEAVADALAATPVAAAAVQQQPQQDVDLFDITSHVQALRENAKDVEQMLIASMSKLQSTYQSEMRAKEEVLVLLRRSIEEKKHKVEEVLGAIRTLSRAFGDTYNGSAANLSVPGGDDEGGGGGGAGGGGDGDGGRKRDRDGDRMETGGSHARQGNQQNQLQCPSSRSLQHQVAHQQQRLQLQQQQQQQPASTVSAASSSEVWDEYAAVKEEEEEEEEEEEAEGREELMGGICLGERDKGRLLQFTEEEEDNEEIGLILGGAVAGGCSRNGAMQKEKGTGKSQLDKEEEQRQEN